MKKLLLTLLAVLLLFIAYLLFNTFTFKSKQLAVAPIEKVAIGEQAIKNFSESLQIKTVSPENLKDFDSVAFFKLREFIQIKYPLTDSLLTKKTFNEFSYLYKWEGSDTSLKPIILLAHTDVVPVIKENLPFWREAPFSGLIKNDTVYGRGAIDDKNSVFGILESVEMLLKQGFKPKRTVYLAFGHDEEIGGKLGAQAMAKYLKEQGVKAKFILDEGGNITQGLIPDVQKDVALIGIAEKGYVSLKLTAKIEGGHSSMPAKETAIDVLGTAISKLKSEPFPAKISDPIKGFIEYIGPEMPFVNKMVFANSNIFGSVITGIYEKSATGNALVRTTTAPTIFKSGVKDNVIPQFAYATVNFRVLPGDTIENIIAHVTQVVNDGRIQVDSYDNFGTEASKVSPINSFGFITVQKTINEIYPNTLVSPYLVIGGTDARHYGEISDNIYRFSPAKINQGNVKTFHGINERLPVDDFKDAVRFYMQIIQNSGK